MRRFRQMCLVLAGSASVLALAQAAAAQTKNIDIPAEDLGPALDEYIHQVGAQLVYDLKDIRGLQSHAVHGQYAPSQALDLMLQGSGAVIKRDASGAVIVVKQNDRRTQADPPPDPVGDRDSGAEEVTVTGTSIRGTAPVGSMVVTLDQKAIRASAPVDMQEMLNTVTAMTKANSPPQVPTRARSFSRRFTMWAAALQTRPWR